MKKRKIDSETDLIQEFQNLQVSKLHSINKVFYTFLQIYTNLYYTSLYVFLFLFKIQGINETFIQSNQESFKRRRIVALEANLSYR